jgi:hypothetical protein
LCKKKFLDDFVVIEKNDDKEEVRTGQRSHQTLNDGNIKSMMYSLASGCQDVRTVTHINAWKTLCSVVKDLDFERLEPKEYHRHRSWLECLVLWWGMCKPG